MKAVHCRKDMHVSSLGLGHEGCSSAFILLYGNRTKPRSNSSLCCGSTHERAALWLKAWIWLSFSALPHMLRMTFVKLFNCSVPGLSGCK